MNRRTQIISVVAALIVVVVGLFAALLLPRPLVYGHYTNLETFPHYYYTNFTITDDYTTLVIDLSINRAGSLVDSYVWIQIYALSIEEFEMSFDVTKAADPESGREIDPGVGFGGSYMGPKHIESTMFEGGYVFVFWVTTSEPVYGWSATLTLTIGTQQSHSTYG